METPAEILARGENLGRAEFAYLLKERLLKVQKEGLEATWETLLTEINSLQHELNEIFIHKQK